MYNENDPKIFEVRKNLAFLGIVAMYGGRKGHGFWLYQSTKENAIRALYDLNFFLSLDLAGKVIKTDGKETGNPCFHSFRQAEKIVIDRNFEATGFYYELGDGLVWNCQGHFVSFQTLSSAIAFTEKYPEFKAECYSKA